MGGKMITRNYNPNPIIAIYDLDNTIIDSEHRQLSNADGSINLEEWFKNCTKEKIKKDTLLPLYNKLVEQYKEGNTIILCTARNMGKYDYEYLYENNIWHDKIISRPNDCTTKDYILKAQQLKYLFNLKQYTKIQKEFYDDNTDNLKALSDLGARVFNAIELNEEMK